MQITEDDELQDELLQVTETEKEKGWLDGPYSVGEVTEMFGRQWLPVRRFAVKQKNKIRPIDDFRESTLNETFGSAEKPELRTMDHVLWTMVILAQYLTFHEHMSFQLSDGTRLDGDVHPEWRRLKPVFKTTCIDLQSAYKQLAVHPNEHRRTVVTLWGQEETTTHVLRFEGAAIWSFSQRSPFPEGQCVFAGGRFIHGLVLGCVL